MADRRKQESLPGTGNPCLSLLLFVTLNNVHRHNCCHKSKYNTYLLKKGFILLTHLINFNNSNKQNFLFLLRCLSKGMNAIVEIQTQRPVSLELYKDYKELGRFMLRYVGSTIAAGVVTEVKCIFTYGSGVIA